MGIILSPSQFHSTSNCGYPRLFESKVGRFGLGIYETDRPYGSFV